MEFHWGWWKVWKGLHVGILEDLCQGKQMQVRTTIAIAHQGQRRSGQIVTRRWVQSSLKSMETTTYYHLFHPPLNLSLWLTRFFSTFTAIVYFILQADEMLKMTSCWIQPIPRILLFGISFCVRFRLSIFRSIFICVEIDASVFLAVWAAAVAIDSFAAAWAGVGFNAIIWKAFYFLFLFFSHNSPAYRLFLS